MKKASKKSKPVTVPSRASMETISFLTGHPKELLRLAKRWGLPGYMANGSVCWKKLRPYFERNLVELTEALPTSSIGLDAQLRQCDLRLRELQIQKLEDQMLDPDEVKKFVAALGTNTSIIIKREMSELPVRVAGKSEADCCIEIDRAMHKIFDCLKNGELRLAMLSRDK